MIDTKPFYYYMSKELRSLANLDTILSTIEQECNGPNKLYSALTIRSCYNYRLSYLQHNDLRMLAEEGILWDSMLNMSEEAMKNEKQND